MSCRIFTNSRYEPAVTSTKRVLPHLFHHILIVRLTGEMLSQPLVHLDQS